MVMGICLPELCPICNKIPKAFWSEVWHRDYAGNNIPVQMYIVRCTDLTCPSEVCISHDYRSPQIEKACIQAWNKIPRDYDE